MNTVSVEILKDLYYMGVNDRETHLFENMWPLPYGELLNNLGLYRLDSSLGSL